MKAFTAALAAAAMLGATQAAAAVRPGDTFSFDLIAYNSSSNSGFYIAGPLTSTFGTTQTFSGKGVDGQDITFASSETVSATSTTDYFRISTPGNFLQDASLDGVTLDAIEFDLGNSNSGSNPVDFTNSIAGASYLGNVYYGASSRSALAPQVTLTNGGVSLSMAEGARAQSGDISALDVHQFDFSVTYNNPVSAAPEPRAWVLMLGGVAMLGAMLRIRKARRDEDAVSDIATA